jgi:hypothetical protein
MKPGRTAVPRLMVILCMVLGFSARLTSQTMRSARSSSTASNSNVASEVDRRSGSSSLGAVDGTDIESVDAQIDSSNVNVDLAQELGAAFPASRGGSRMSFLLSRYNSVLPLGQRTQAMTPLAGGLQNRSAAGMLPALASRGQAGPSQTPGVLARGAVRASSAVHGAHGLSSAAVPSLNSTQKDARKGSSGLTPKGASAGRPVVGREPQGAEVPPADDVRTDDTSGQPAASNDSSGSSATEGSSIAEPSSTGSVPSVQTGAFEMLADPFRSSMGPSFERLSGPGFDRPCGSACGSSSSATGTVDMSSSDESSSDETPASASASASARHSPNLIRSRSTGRTGAGRFASDQNASHLRKRNGQGESGSSRSPSDLRSRD